MPATTPVRDIFYVPEARVMRLPDTLQKTAEVGEDIEIVQVGDKQVRVRDIVSLEVTRNANGPGEYKLVLNNWDQAARKQKYNDFTRLNFGMRLRIDMRYVRDPGVADDPATEDVDEREQALEKIWRPMIAGPITDMQFSLGADGDRVSIGGEDDLRPLKNHVANRIQHKRKSEQKIFRDTLDALDYPLAPRFDDDLPNQLRHLQFLRDDKNGINESLEPGQSPLEFLQKLIEKYDVEMFLDFDHTPDQPPPWPQMLRVAPSRASVGPGSTLIARLKRDRHIIDFTPTLKVADVFTRVRVRGRNRHRNEPKGIDGKAGEAELLEELKHYEVPGGPPLASAIALRPPLFGANESNDKQKTNLDEFRAEAAAHATLMRNARQFLTIQVTAVGVTRLAPRQFVQIDGIGAPFDGRYYVTTTTHTFGSDGMKTRFNACRPGMPDLRTAQQGAA